MSVEWDDDNVPVSELARRRAEELRAQRLERERSIDYRRAVLVPRKSEPVRLPAESWTLAEVVEHVRGAIIERGVLSPSECDVCAQVSALLEMLADANDDPPAAS